MNLALLHNAFYSFYVQLIETVTILIIMSTVYLVLTLLVAPRIESDREGQRFKIRVTYLTVFIFLTLMIRIWFTGFNTIFTVLGVVIAALVVTNKETIMNFTGWLIIQWRELFTEGDHIQIQNYSGQVRNIGILYITLLEYITDSERLTTGRIIRIPNGVVVNTQIINYSQTSHFLAYKMSFVITADSDLLLAVQLTANTIRDAVVNYYQYRPEYNREYLLRKNRKYFSMVNMEVYVGVTPQLEVPCGVKLTAYYYCYALDHEAIEQKIWLVLLPLLQCHETVKISYAN